MRAHPTHADSRSTAQTDDGTASWQLGHRPSLDAMRGIAVLLVLAGHGRLLNETAATVGVSLFFALSGYLITALLLGEWAARGRVDVRRFYVRRARRLLPALIVLLVALALAAAARNELGRWSLAAVPSMLYVGNWAFLAGTLPHDLWHTWSLAIEEQFYLVWPVVLVALLSRGFATVRVALVALIVASFLLTLAVEWPNLGLAYYGSPERAKELLAGAFVAVLSFSRGRDVSPHWLLAAGSVALLGLSSSVSVMGTLGTAVFAIPCAVVVAWAAAHPRLLAWRPLTGTGRISYGLYLYHYPLVIVFPAVLALPLTFAAAATSWMIVERRFLVARKDPGAADEVNLETRMLGSLAFENRG